MKKGVGYLWIALGCAGACVVCAGVGLKGGSIVAEGAGCWFVLLGLFSRG